MQSKIIENNSEGVIFCEAADFLPPTFLKKWIDTKVVFKILLSLKKYLL